MGREMLNSPRNGRLIAEAMLLTREIAALEKKREADLIEQYGKLAVWYDENIDSDPARSLAADKVGALIKEKIGMTTVEDLAEEGLKQTLLTIIRLAGFTVSTALTKGVGIAASIILKSADTGGLKGAYMDTRSGGDLEKKQERLAQIYTELFFMDPPLKPSIEISPCAVQACISPR
ncbi:MAG: hypothetical protein JO290_03800 [Sphingomonadaceae bacterium]|nr:hypothetical protein [Sphingomonadaceae bacterium]